MVEKRDYTGSRGDRDRGRDDGSDHGQRDQHRRSPASQVEAVAFMLLAGVVVGLLIGYGLDRLLHTTPVFLVIGVFAGFGIALYGVYLETK